MDWSRSTERRWTWRAASWRTIWPARATTPVAVERNGDIVPKRLYGETVLADGDALEIVGFVGGG